MLISLKNSEAANEAGTEESRGQGFKLSNK